MRAAVLHGVGEKVVVEQVDDLVVGPGQAVVRVLFAALNHRDVWIQKGQYAGLKFPIILGSDCSGIVDAVGPDVDPGWVDRPVVVNPALDLGNSTAHQNHRHFRILGLPDNGCFAEKVLVPAVNLHAIGGDLSDEEWAAIPLAGVTAYRALVTRGGLKAGEQVLVTGAGGGSAGFAVQIAAALGAKVYVTSGSASKIDSAIKLGAISGVNYREEDWDKQLKDVAGGFDLIIDSAGGDGFAKLIELANPGGRIAFFGSTAGNPSGFDMRRVFWKQLTILGTTMGSPDDFRAMVNLYETKALHPRIDSVRPLEEAEEAFAHMAGGHLDGKIVLKVG